MYYYSPLFDSVSLNKCLHLFFYYGKKKKKEETSTAEFPLWSGKVDLLIEVEKKDLVVVFFFVWSYVDVYVVNYSECRSFRKLYDDV